MPHSSRLGRPLVAGTIVAIVLAACGSGPAAHVTTPARPSPVHPLSDGQGNPPTGWGNPYQQGTMTLISPAEAVFRDSVGHQVQFRLRPGAKAFKHLCS